MGDNGIDPAKPIHAGYTCFGKEIVIERIPPARNLYRARIVGSPNQPPCFDGCFTSFSAVTAAVELYHSIKKPT